jgi:hypothetical protein
MLLSSFLIWIEPFSKKISSTPHLNLLFPFNAFWCFSNDHMSITKNYHNPHKSQLNLLLEWIEPLARITHPKMSVCHKNPARKTKFATRIQGKKK